MTELTQYECQKCGSIKETSDDTPVPVCCGRPMLKDEPVDVCEPGFGAEDSRMDNLGDPCDDGRSGKI